MTAGTEQPDLVGVSSRSAYSRTLVRLEELSKVYGSEPNETHALNDVSLTIQEGEYCAIMGQSGSGKSTAMNIVGCLDRATTGRYYLENQDVAQLPEATLAKIRNRKIGFVFQQFHLLPQLSAVDNVLLPMIYGGVPLRFRRQRATRALKRVGLGNRLHHKPNQLSGGQQQRVAIARAIVNQPLLLLADEPTGALDTQTTQEVLSIFEELHASGITVIIVTHEPTVAKRAERIIWFQDGAVVDDHLSPEAMLARIAA
ncbi:MAG: ABC transporter ATP-binding protein [Cyanobacteria bacterium P01_H01_bin.15]